jgi:hypothetical protein
MQRGIQNAINKINSAASIAMCSTDVINEVKCAASNSLYSRVPFIKLSLLPTMQFIQQEALNKNK